MTAGRRFSLHPGAAQDLEEIWEYIAFDSLESARLLREALLARFELLALFPDQGHRRPELSSQRLRFLVVEDYLIGYMPETDPPTIISIMHSRRAPREIASVLRSRT